MTLQTLIEDLPQLINLPDLILIAFLSASLTLGAQRGFLRTLISLCGRLATILGATLLARQCAPAVAQAVVTPLIGGLFRSRAQSYFDGLPPAAADALLTEAQTRVTDAAARMAEGAAFLVLLAVGIAAMTVVLKLLSSAARMITRFSPIGLLDRAAGALVGLVSGVFLALMLLWLIHLISPDLFAPYGWLSPDAIQNTLVLRVLLEYFPVI